MEWIAAHGHEPRGAWFVLNELAAVAVPEGVCAFAQSMAQIVKSKPEAAVVFTTACDQMRRAADAVATQNSSRAFLFNLPATWQTAAARRLYHAEVERLGKFLERLGGLSPSEIELDRAINECEAKRAPMRAATGLKRFSDLPARSGPFPQGERESGPALETVSARRTFQSPQLSVPSPWGEGQGEGKGDVANLEVHHKGNAPHASRGIPLALIGGPLVPRQRSLFDAIESAGGHVVLNATEPGERSLLPPMSKSASGKSRRSTLADHYFDHIVDVFQRPNSRLYAWLAPRLAERGVRGLVLWAHVGCDLWRAEAASLRETFGLPLIVLESHEIHTGNLRDASRLAAFVESLQ